MRCHRYIKQLDSSLLIVEVGRHSKRRQCLQNNTITVHMYMNLCKINVNIV